MRSTSITRSRVLAASTAFALAALSVRVGLSADAVLCLAPALAMAALLFARRYPGERVLVRIRTRASGRRPRPARSIAAPARAAARTPRGGLLIAFALAVRPPPVATLTS